MKQKCEQENKAWAVGLVRDYEVRGMRMGGILAGEMSIGCSDDCYELGECGQLVNGGLDMGSSFFFLRIVFASQNGGS